MIDIKIKKEILKQYVQYINTFHNTTSRFKSLTSLDIETFLRIKKNL